MSSCRDAVNGYILESYGASPEFLWERDPSSCIYRRSDNRKWFGIIMVIPRDRLGLDGSERVEILNVKLSDALTAELVAQSDGFFKAYHMSAGSTWVTVLLDGTVAPEVIFPLIDESYAVTAPKQRRKKKAKQ